MWFEESVFYQLYPLTLCGAPAVNAPVSGSAQAGSHGRGGIGRRMHVPLADDGDVGKLRRRLAQQIDVGALVQRRLDGRLVVREGRGHQVAAACHGPADVIDGHAISHHQRLGPLADRRERLGKGATVRARPVRRVEGNHIGTRVDHGQRMAQRRGDVDPLVALLPQADDRDVHPTLDGRDVGEPLAADGRRAAQLAGARHLRHGLGMAQRLAGICLHADDELAPYGFDDRMHVVLLRWSTPVRDMRMRPRSQRHR